MKKILGLILSAFLIVGCSGQKSQDEGDKTKAIEAYVNNVNSFRDKSIDIDLNGKLDVPKSAIITEAQSGTLALKGTYDVKSNLAKMDFEFADGKNNTKMNMYIDKEFVYLGAQGKWVKQALDVSAKESLDKQQKGSKLSVEDATKSFDAFKKVNYSQDTQDGVKGYKIDAKLNLEELLSLVDDYAKNDEKRKKEIGQLKQMFQNFDISYSMFAPEEATQVAKHTLSIDMEVMKNKMTLGPIDIKVKPSTAKVVIPSDVKKANEQKIQPVSTGL